MELPNRNEDIEISLNNKEKIYVQAKAKEHINNSVYKFDEIKRTVIGQ